MALIGIWGACCVAEIIKIDFHNLSSRARVHDSEAVEVARPVTEFGWDVERKLVVVNLYRDLSISLIGRGIIGAVDRAHGGNCWAVADGSGRFVMSAQWRHSWPSCIMLSLLSRGFARQLDQPGIAKSYLVSRLKGRSK